MPPNKAAALAYLDNGGPLPRRSAQAIVIRGGLPEPDVMIYKVSFWAASGSSGQLDISSGSKRPQPFVSADIGEIEATCTTAVSDCYVAVRVPILMWWAL